MENQFITSDQPNYFKRRFAIILVFAVFFIMLGRNLSFLPVINLSMNTKEEDLQIQIEKIIKGKGGSYSIYYKNYNSGKSFGIDENQINTAASVNKVPVIAALYLMAKEDKISLDDKVTIQKEDIQDYGTGSLRYQKMPQNYSFRNLAKLALKESDNTAAHVIAIKIGEDNIQNLINSWGMKQTSMVDNKTSVVDMELMFRKIYNNEITDAANTKEFLSFMNQTEFEDRLTKDLPNSTISYHKAGDGEGFVHDVGIIQSPKGTYYLGVMTSDVQGSEDKAKNTIAEISKTVFDALNN